MYGTLQELHTYVDFLMHKYGKDTPVTSFLTLPTDVMMTGELGKVRDCDMLEAIEIVKDLDNYPRILKAIDDSIEEMKGFIDAD
jgi:hypothetical protein